MYWCSFLKNQQWSKDYDEGLSDAGKAWKRQRIWEGSASFIHFDENCANRSLVGNYLELTTSRPCFIATKVLKNEVPEEKARIYLSTELLSKLRLKNEDFWKFSLRSKRFRASSWRMLGWEQKREMNWTFISFALTPTFVRLLERKLDNIHLHRSVIFTQRLCHGHADDVFPIFFVFTETVMS